MDIALVMNHILPDAQWICKEDTYETLEMLDENIKPSIVELEDTWSFIQKDKIEQNQKIEASKVRDEAMLKGFAYNGIDISVTKDDGDGMVQVKASFELGLTSTVIHFANGSKLPMTAEEFPDFALQFVTERGKFFV